MQPLLTEVALDDPDATQDLRRLGAHLLRANERNERLIEGLLVLAEADRGLPGTVPVRLDELAGVILPRHAERTVASFCAGSSPRPAVPTSRCTARARPRRRRSPASRRLGGHGRRLTATMTPLLKPSSAQTSSAFSSRR